MDSRFRVNDVRSIVPHLAHDTLAGRNIQLLVHRFLSYHERLPRLQERLGARA